MLQYEPEWDNYFFNIYMILKPYYKAKALSTSYFNFFTLTSYNACLLTKLC